MIKYKNLITSDMINLVKSECENNPVLNKYDTTALFAVRIGSVMVEKYGGQKPQLNVKEGLNNEYIRLWKKDVGNILVKELKKDDPELYEMRTSKIRVMLKRIDEEELPKFTDDGFAHIQIADKWFTIIKIVNNKSTYSYMTSDFEIHEEYDVIVKEEKEKKEEPEKEEVKELVSIRLF